MPPFLTNFYSQNQATLYYTPELDAIIDEALRTVDNTQRGKLIERAYKIMDKTCRLSL